MAETLLARILLPMALTGSVACVVLLALRPLLNRLKAALRKALALCAALLFLLPLPALALWPAGGQGGNAPLGQALGNAPATAPVYNAGRQLARALEEPAPQPGAENAPQTVQPNDGAGGWTTPRPAQLMLMGWAAGGAVLLGWWAAGYLRFRRRLARSATTRGAGPAEALYAQLCGQMGLRRAPALLYAPAAPAPMLAGLLRPRIVLPAACPPGQPLEYALRHELTHYKKHDLVFKHLMLLVCALHWWNPLAHLLRRSYAAVCEQCCDEAVTAHYSHAQRKAYAGTLLAFAGPCAPAAVSAFASPKKQLHERMKRLMKPVKPSRRQSVAGAGLAALLLCAALLAGCSLSAGALTPGSSASGGPSSVIDIIEPAPVSSLPPDSSSLPDAPPPSDSSAAGTDAAQEDTPDDDLPGSFAGSYQLPVPELEYVSRLMSAGHRGVDFTAPLGTAIYASEAGTVTVADWHYSYGNYVVILHPDGLSTLYAHCHSLEVEAGAVVQRGQLIATVGATGNSAGPHLHLEFIEGDASDPDHPGTLLNPEDYITLPEGIQGVTEP